MSPGGPESWVGEVPKGPTLCPRREGDPAGSQTGGLRHCTQSSSCCAELPSCGRLLRQPRESHTPVSVHLGAVHRAEPGVPASASSPHLVRG